MNKAGECDFAVVVEERNKYYGRLGRVKSFNKENMTVIFNDGKLEENSFGYGCVQLDMFYVHDDSTGADCDLDPLGGWGPRSLAQKVHDAGQITISEFVDSYRKLFGRNPEKYG